MVQALESGTEIPVSFKPNLANIQEEGEFYNINIPPEYEDEVEKVRNKMEDNHVNLFSQRHFR